VTDSDAGGAPGRRPPTWLLAGAGVVAGVVLGLGAAALAGGGDGNDGGPTVTLAPVESPYPADQAANAEQFLDAWNRYRTATFKAELTWTRETASGQRLETLRTVVQQPPERAVRQFGSVTLVGADESLGCEPIGDDTVCTSRPGADYDLQVADEIAAWRSAITGERPIYAVHRSGGECFELELVRPIAEPPYGERSQVCFDEATGALRSRQVVHATATEIEQATSITPTVTAQDWEAVRA
jgi:hypothetical protein